MENIQEVFIEKLADILVSAEVEEHNKVWDEIIDDWGGELPKGFRPWESNEFNVDDEMCLHMSYNMSNGL